MKPEKRTTPEESLATVFCIVGPTATGKSALAADVAARLGAEIVNADAFQLYEGFDVLSGKPDPAILRKAPHHLIGAISATEEMNAARYRALALPLIADISSRGKLPLLVGGSGLYVRALTHGLDEMPAADARLREKLNEMSLAELQKRLTKLDPPTAKQIDVKNRRRVIRAIEICLSSGRSVSAQRMKWNENSLRSDDGQSGVGPAVAGPMISETSASGRCHNEADSLRLDYTGIFVFRDREELYQRINNRVEAMLDNGAIEEVRDGGELGCTVGQMIGIKDIRKYLSGEISRAECLTRIQQLTRRYAKRQLTWFRRQTNLEPLNLSLLSNNEAFLRVSCRAVAQRVGND